MKRYLRLALPVLIVSLFVYGISLFGLFYHNTIIELTGSPWLQLFYQVPLSLKSVFETSFYTVWFVGNDTFSTAYWMLTHLFYGSLLTYGVIYLIRNFNPRFQLIFILIVLFITTILDSYLVNFGYGMTMAWLIYHQVTLSRNKIPILFGFISGILLAGFPQGVQPKNFYSLFLFLNEFVTTSIHVHALGAFLIILSIQYLKQLKSIFESSYPQMLGRYSYSIYLTHIPLLFSISTILFILFNRYSLNYGINILFVLVISLVSLLLVSMFFNRFVISTVNKHTNNLFISKIS